MPHRVLFYGDSNTWGYKPGGSRLPSNRRFTTVATRQLFTLVPVVDGLNGRCSARSHPAFPPELLGGATFADSFEQALPLDGLVLMLGTNDVMPPLNLRADEICANLRGMVDEARARAGRDLAVLVVSPPPLNAAAVKRLTEEGGIPEILEQDLAAPMRAMAREAGVRFLDGGSYVECMGAEDGYHLDDIGHHRLGLAIGRELRLLLENPDSNPKAV